MHPKSSPASFFYSTHVTVVSLCMSLFFVKLVTHVRLFLATKLIEGCSQRMFTAGIKRVEARLVHSYQRVCVTLKKRRPSRPLPNRPPKLRCLDSNWYTTQKTNGISCAVGVLYPFSVSKGVIWSRRPQRTRPMTHISSTPLSRLLVVVVVLCRLLLPRPWLALVWRWRRHRGPCFHGTYRPYSAHTRTKRNFNLGSVSCTPSRPSTRRAAVTAPRRGPSCAG